MNFLGSSSSFASTPASNGSSSNGLSLDVSCAPVSAIAASDDAVSSVLNCVSSLGVSSAGAVSAVGSAGAGAVLPSFNLYLISSRLFF